MRATPVQAREQTARHKWTDRAGVLAAAACAVHCMAAPLVLAFAPLVGGIWASPVTHWVFAAVSLPAALSLLRRRMRDHTLGLRRWLIGLAVAGAALVVLGLSAPNASWSDGLGLDVPCPSWMPQPDDAAAHSHCQDECCASVQSDESGSTTFHLPLASVVTMLGGLLLITAHGLAMRTAVCCDTHKG